VGQETQMKFAWRIVSLLVGAVFVFAGVSKIVDFQPFRFLDPMAFARDIDNYKILPWGISVLLALYLPWLEVICGLALAFRRLYSGALALLLALLVVFIGASFAAKARGIDITCGCFGHVSDHLSFAWHMALDFAIFAAVFALWRWNRELRPAAEPASA
jgi:putative oxidoreductase